MGLTAYNYRTSTVLVDGSISLVSLFAVWPLAVRAVRFTFDSACYLAGLWLSTSMANPTPVKIAAWVASQVGAFDAGTGTEFINLTNAQNVWLSHISQNVVTTSKASGIGWAIPEMPLFAAGEHITVWMTNGNDAGVQIDAALTLYLVDPPARPITTDQSGAGARGIGSVWSRPV
jgi:hypothetical protein